MTGWTGHEYDFLSVDGTRIRSELRRVRGGYFFPALWVTRWVPDALLEL
jgi:hypothetical protein